MKEEIVDLLLWLDSEDVEEKSATITDIAMLLEMNTYILNGGQSASRLKDYENYLSGDLISIRLNMEEQREIIDEFTKRISTKDQLSSSMFWAIGKAYPTVGLPELIKNIKCCWNTFDDEVSYQIIIALENFIDYDMVKDSVGKLLPKEKELMSFIRSMSESNNVRLSESSSRVLAKLSK